jgi:hypothetical protein
MFRSRCKDSINMRGDVGFLRKVLHMIGVEWSKIFAPLDLLSKAPYDHYNRRNKSSQ